ncbi:MAG: CBS domain-containing protein [Nitrosotalea sp.]
MNSLAAYEQLKNIRERKVSRIIGPATTIEPTVSVSKLIGMMLRDDSYDVFCMNGREVSTINARELLTSRDVKNMKISPLLHKVQAIRRNDTLEKAAAIMSHNRMRSVPVVEDGKIIGAVNIKEIIKLLNQENLNWISASDILTPNPITIGSNELLSSARQTMATKKIDHLPVISGGKVSQVLTSMHLLHFAVPEERIGSGMRGRNTERRFGSQVGNAGSTRVPNCLTSASLNTVMGAMLKADTSCCLLTLWDNLHGIITYKDLLGILESRIQSTVPLYIIGLPENLGNAQIIKEKFDKIIRNLIKSYPEVEEAKASIKTMHNHESKGDHYKVVIRIMTPYRSYSYSELGWDLSKVFDILGNKVTRNLSNRSKKRWKTSVRKIEKRNIF